MENLLVNVALATAIFEERKNFLDTYYPFLLKTFIPNHFHTIDEISKNLNSSFGFNLPIHSIKSIIVRNENSIFKINKSKKGKWEVNLTQKGITELNSLNAEENKIETSLSSFYYNFKEFSEKKFKKNYDIKLVEDLVKNFIKKNILDISLNNEIKQINNYDNEFDKHFILFLSYIKNTNTELTEIFATIWKGIVIWNELKKEDFHQVPLEFGKPINVYVDTNFILSLLGLHNPIINKAAKELYNLIKSTKNINLYVLDVTIKELWALLDLYPQFKNDYYDIEVDSVFYYLKKKSYTLAEVEKLKDNLIDKLNIDFGISFVETNFLDKKMQQWYAEIYEHLYEIRKVINERKPQKLHKTTNAIEKNAHHDTSAIIHILSEKNRKSTNLENCKSIFLTSGFWLYKNYRNIYSKFEGFPSIILDSILTNILYLKNPEVNAVISIDQVIKMHSNYFIIDHNIWTLFISYTKELLNEKRIDIEDYTLLVSKNQMSEEALVDISPDDISHEKILELLEKIKADEYEKKEKVESYKIELNEKDRKIENLTERVSTLEKEILLSKSKDKYEKEKEAFNLKLSTFVDEEWSKEIKRIKSTLLWYSIFLIFSFIVFSITYFLNLDSQKIQNEYNFTSSRIKMIGYILAGLIFLGTSIRSFFNHEVVLDGIKMFSKNYRNKKKENFINYKTEQFKKINKEPNLEQFISVSGI